MTDYFEWNGVKSTDYGIHVSEHPAVTLPSERVTFTDIPGRSGSLTTTEGDDVYSDMTLSATCWVENLDNLTAITKWLKGAGTVTFGNRLGGYYEARIINQIAFDRILRGKANRKFAVNFRCKPFFYLNDSPVQTITTSGTVLTNPGSLFSEPMLTVYGSGDITLMVGQTIIILQSVSGHVTLSTPAQEAYRTETNGTLTSLNNTMVGDFPILATGETAISWSGSVTSVVVQPNWRTL